MLHKVHKRHTVHKQPHKAHRHRTVHLPLLRKEHKPHKERMHCTERKHRKGHKHRTWPWLSKQSMQHKARIAPPPELPLKPPQGRLQPSASAQYSLSLTLSLSFQDRSGVFDLRELRKRSASHHPPKRASSGTSAQARFAFSMKPAMSVSQVS